jgi:pyrroline-5-carboxylate reductase
MERQRIVFVGGGNMARSLIGGLTADGYPANAISVVEPQAEQRTLLNERFGVAVTDDGPSGVADADIVVLAVKPQVMHDVVTGLAPALAARRPLVISVAAGVRAPDIGRWLGYHGPLVPCMPNTPSRSLYPPSSS